LSEPHKSNKMAQKREGALDRAVRFFNELSKKTLTRTEVKDLAKEFGVRNGLDRFAIDRKWCRVLPVKKNPHKRGRGSAVLEFRDLSEISPLHVRLLLEDANAYVKESVKRKAEKKVQAEETNEVADTSEFKWTSETTKLFAKVYSGNFRTLPSRFEYKTYHGLSMDEKVKQFMIDFVRPETQQVTVSVVETFTRKQSRTIEIPGDVNIKEYLATNLSVYDFQQDMPTLEGTPFADTSELKLSNSNYTYEDEDGVEGTL